MKKFIKMILIFLISTIVIYSILTMIKFYNWCNENQISLFIEGELSNQMNNLMKYKIDGLGNEIRNMEILMKDSKDYDPLGLAIWRNMQEGIGFVFTWFRNISIFLGIAISFGYIIIFNEKINNLLKIIVGYLGTVLFILFTFYHSNHVFGIPQRNQCMIYFYIIYTITFVLMYIKKIIIDKKNKIST